ncbi:MAG: low-specificity L-threonine aldolase [Firmicutes bacterium]|nr:low-specificity L-threonine aldolase [Bacillota bacterium]
MRVIDLRSDTVTLPCDKMREAMANAAVGDDVYGEDPTVNELQVKAAQLAGKEAALFVPSGTAGNLIAVLTHSERGQEVILDKEGHIYYYEVGSAAMFGGVQLNTVAGLLSENGPEVLAKAFRPANLHFPPTGLVCLENTFNRGGGTVMSAKTMSKMYNMCKERNLNVHLDGARIFHAATASGVNVKEFTRSCDSVMFCLSKGLGAPVGSLLAGSEEFIEKALRYRKALGGGLRQAGILAAAGLVALENITRLSEDHANAGRLAQALNDLPGLEIDLNSVQTNIISVNFSGQITAAEFVQKMAEKGVKCNATGPYSVRLVTHLNISGSDVDRAISIIESIIKQS